MANFQVFIYPNDWSLWNDAQTVREGLVEAVESLESHGSITGYSIDIRLDMPEVSDWDAFESWRESTHSDVGIHFWLTGSYGYGLANGGDPSENGWNAPMDAKIHTGTADFRGYKQELAVQECLHPCLFSPAIDDWIENDEHELGTSRWTGGSWKVTPMAVSYEDSYRENGSCASSAGWSGYTLELSHCTKEAIKACNPWV